MIRVPIAATTALVAMTATAMAADIPRHVKAPPAPVVAPLPGWAGFYGGMVGAVGTARGSASDNNLNEFDGDSFGHSFGGGMAGLHFGYNWQRGRVVFGADADLSAAEMKKLTYEGTTDDAIYTSISALGTIRGRLGFLATERALVYGTAGVAFGHLTQLAGDVECPGDESNCPSNRIGFDDDDSAWNLGKWRVGWTAGAGVELKLTQNWSVRGEYLYVDLGSYTAVVPDNSTESAVFRNTMHLGRAALTYRF